MAGIKHHILVSDRNPNVRRFLRREFVQRGYEVSMAGNAADVLAALNRKNPPVLLLMDMNLPGCEAQGFWRALLAAPGPPFIVAHAFHGDALPEDLEGRAARVIKNGDMDSLARAISWCLTQTSRTLTKAD